MKFLCYFGLALIGTIPLNAQNAPQIQQIIEQYNKGGETNDVMLLDSLLGESFRIVLNDTKEELIKVLDRATYLDLIGKKIFGGETRILDFTSIDEQGSLTATVTVTQKGSTNNFRNYLSLVNHKGNWQIIQALVYIE